MVGLVVAASIWIVGCCYMALYRYAPSNRLIRRWRARPRLRAAAAGVVLGLAYLLIAASATTLLDRGGPRWLHLVVLVGIWTGLKYLAAAVFVGLAWAKHQLHRLLTRHPEPPVPTT